MAPTRGSHTPPIRTFRGCLFLLPAEIVLLLLPLTTAQPLHSHEVASYYTTTSLVSRFDSLQHFPHLPNAARAPLSRSVVAAMQRRQAIGPDPDPSNPFNYFYIFIAVFVIIVIIALWGSRRRHQRRKAILLNRRQSALQQDATGWPTTRRWLHGNRRQGSDDIREYYHREEGLDARGEAPPPYMPGNNNEPRQQPGDPAHLTVPQAALTRDSPHKPPEYQATVTPVADVRVDDDARATPGSSSTHEEQ
ncbi:hypothetical protein FH972_026477 [Carpinus fangiana]|uniref:Uncharacterized protein n=1 Tax=Carpinus fangiana TaxID=176857 RepID=A0A5N6L435_9ROSI|nr:hypothetical protein FH972_026477 [Carpinus fangiana]